jgi:Zn-dependent metalloprotease
MRSTRHDRAPNEWTFGLYLTTARGRRALVAGLLVAVSLCAVPSGSARAQGETTTPAPSAHTESENADPGLPTGRIVDLYRATGSPEDAKAAESRPEWVSEALALSLARIDRDDVKGPRKLRDAGEDLRMRSALRDDLGQTHLRLAQLHEGVEVFGGQLVSHLGGGSEPEIGGRTFDVVGIDTTPVLDAAQAVEAAKTAHALAGRLSAEPTAGLLVLPHEVFDYEAEGEATLCWRVTLRVEGQADASGTFDYFVDAQDGHVVWRHAADMRGSGTSFYSGNVPVASTLAGIKYSMTDTNHGSSKVYDLNGALSGAGVQMTDYDDVWADSAATARQKAAVDVQFGVAKSWDYFADVFGWRGMNGVGGEVTGKVHWGTAREDAQNEAGTNHLRFGDGDGRRTSAWVALDIVGHEFMHGVTDNTAGLVYMNEAGAINESFSDIFGTAVEWSVGPIGGRNPDYLCSEDIYLLGGWRNALRDMTNPTRLGDTDGTTWVTHRDYYGNLYTGAWDNGGVHINSGIMNNAFYLMSEGGANHTTGLSVPAIGRRNAERIFYRALTAYLFPSAKFYDARVATVNAAADLFGPGSAEVIATEKAWNAVGVTGPTLFFYNKDNGAAAAARISNGAFYQMAGWSPGAFALNWTEIVPTRHGLFYYNRITGLYAVTRMDFYGSVSQLSWGYLPSNYSTVVSTDNGILLYHSDGRGLVIQVSVAGSVSVRQTFPAGSFGYWSHIVSTPGGLLFYNRETGTIAVCRIGPDGSWSQTDARFNYLGRNHGVVMAIGADVLFYNSTTGAYELGRVADGRYSVIDTWTCPQAIGPGLYRIVKHGADIFFYNPDTGEARVVRRNFCGLQVVKVYPPGHFGANWSTLVSTVDGLFFYNKYNGSGAVGGFNADGSFYQTAGYPAGTFGTYWSHVMRLTR